MINNAADGEYWSWSSIQGTNEWYISNAKETDVNGKYIANTKYQLISNGMWYAEHCTDCNVSRVKSWQHTNNPQYVLHVFRATEKAVWILASFNVSTRNTTQRHRITCHESEYPSFKPFADLRETPWSSTDNRDPLSPNSYIKAAIKPYLQSPGKFIIQFNATPTSTKTG